MANMRYLFEPRSIAVIGASHDKAKIGYTVLANVVLGGYHPHKVYPINPQGGEILGLRVFRGLEEIDESIDLAYIVILISNFCEKRLRNFSKFSCPIK
jgi:acyl-CoA synthetase (NDP forming)